MNRSVSKNQIPIIVFCCFNLKIEEARLFSFSFFRVQTTSKTFADIRCLVFGCWSLRPCKEKTVSTLITTIRNSRSCLAQNLKWRNSYITLFKSFIDLFRNSRVWIPLTFLAFFPNQSKLQKSTLFLALAESRWSLI